VSAGRTGANAAFRCSVSSRALTEPLEGTASTVRAFLLVEAPGPWGVDAVRDCRMDAAVKQRLLDLERHNRVRPLLVRRHGGRATGPSRVFAAYVHTERPWVRTAALDDVRDLLDLDLGGLGSGRPPGLELHEDPIFLVCTHGRHDACCAERGRPLAAAMAQAAPELTWEVSHIGGDRFAANLLVLPDGLYYGRLEPQDAAGFVDAHLAGRLDVEHLRGRSSYPFSVQAAEIYLRRHLGLDGIAPLPLVEHARHATETRAVFGVGGARWEVHVHAEVGEPRQLTCRAGAPSVGFSHVLLGLSEL
jgi:(2Fe-2S) ferredoxin